MTEFMLAMGLQDRMAGTAYLDDSIWPRYETEVRMCHWPCRGVDLRPRGRRRCVYVCARCGGGGGGGGMHRDVGADGLSASRREHEILSALRDADTDFLVLARYMQVLSAGFLRAYGRDVLNIHHGLLPSFKGGHPYRQAYVAGVRVIGATAHYVTEHLDEGPIVAQNVISVTHRQSLSAIKDLSQRLETETLSDAVALVANARVVRISLGRLAVMN